MVKAESKEYFKILIEIGYWEKENQSFRQSIYKAYKYETNETKVKPTI